MTHELILHHYPMSPFSERVRLALGLKNLDWRSLEVNWTLPRPHTMPLTGGYRRIPILQIGADIYCDTLLIARELERRFPQPPLEPGGLAQAIGAWSGSRFFRAAMPLALTALGDQLTEDFIEDRRRMTGAGFDMERVRAAVPAMREHFRAQLGWLDEALADGRDWLGGEAPSWLDLNAHTQVWFARRFGGEGAAQVAAFPEVAAWADRLEAAGHGRPQPVAGEEALEIARAAEPETVPGVDPGEPNGLQPGEAITVSADDYGTDPVAGELVSASAQHVALRRHDAQAGDVVVHFPRAGYLVARA